MFLHLLVVMRKFARQAAQTLPNTQYLFQYIDQSFTILCQIFDV